MVFNTIFNNISAIWWRSVLFVKETGVPGKKHQPAVSHRQILSHNVVSSTPRLVWIQIYTDCICSCKSKYHTMMTTTAPLL